MILFLGDSFTWGQGLHIDSLVNGGFSDAYINSQLPPLHLSENLSYDQDVIRKKYHFPNLTAKYFNRPYCTKYGNGGCNQDILDILENLHNQINTDSIELLVIQLTAATRDDSFAIQYTAEKNYNEYLEYYVKNIIYKIEEYSQTISTQPNPIPFIVMSWQEDISDICQRILGNRFLKFGNHNNIEYLMSSNPLFEISRKYNGIYDYHPTIECHKVISEYLISKVNELDIVFNHYNFVNNE